MTMHNPLPEDQVVLLFAAPEEAQEVQAKLASAALTCRQCAGAQDLCQNLESAAAAVISQEALTAPVMSRLVQTLDCSPDRADFPFVLLFDSPGTTAKDAIRLLDLLEPFGNLTVLERPAPTLALVSAVRTAVRCQHAQRRAREVLQRLQNELSDRENRLARLVHKLRTPLNTILTATEILDQIGASSPLAAEQRALVQRQTLLLAQLLGEFQEPAETVLDSVSLGRQPVDLKVAAPDGEGRGHDGMASAGPCRLLVVEDDKECREALQFLLRLKGMEVDVAADGPQGLQKALAGDADVVLLDIELPGLDGFEVARRIRDRRGDGVRLVALTGLGKECDRRKATAAGFDDCLIKPVTLQELSRALAVCPREERSKPPT